MKARTVLAGLFLFAVATAEAKPSVTWSVTLRSEEAGASSKLDDLLASARADRRPALIEFTAAWCAACRLFDRDTYTDPDVIRETRRFVTIRIDATNADAADGELARRFGVRGLPTLVFVSSRGAVPASSSLLGLVDAKTLARGLREIP